jgi:hypothetical protein
MKCEVKTNQTLVSDNFLFKFFEKIFRSWRWRSFAEHGRKLSLKNERVPKFYFKLNLLKNSTLKILRKKKILIEEVQARLPRSKLLCRWEVLRCASGDRDFGLEPAVRNCARRSSLPFYRKQSWNIFNRDFVDYSLQLNDS